MEGTGSRGSLCGLVRSHPTPVLGPRNQNQHFRIKGLCLKGLTRGDFGTKMSLEGRAFGLKARIPLLRTRITR
jgi:hypothetical protein